MQINLLSGNEDLQELINRISSTITQAENATMQVEEALVTITPLMNQLPGLIQQSINSADSANQAANSANQSSTSANQAATSANEASQRANENANLANAAYLQAIEATQMANSLISSLESLEEDLRGYGLNITDFTLGTSFIKKQYARFNGSTYQAKVNTQGNPLPVAPQLENQWWTLIAQRGVDGNGAVSSVNGILPDVSGNITLNTPEPTWDSILNKPSTFTPSAHTHQISEVTGLQQILDNNPSKTERKVEHFTATQGQTVFTLSEQYEPGKNLIELIVGGVPQFPGENFTESSNNTVTLSQGVPLGTKVTAVYYTELAIAGNIPTASVSIPGVIKVDNIDFSVDGNATLKNLKPNQTFIDNTVTPSKLFADFNIGLTLSIPNVSATDVTHRSWKKIVGDFVESSAIGDSTTLSLFRFEIETLKRSANFAQQTLRVYNNQTQSSHALLYTMTRSTALSSPYAWQDWRYTAHTLVGKGSPMNNYSALPGVQYFDITNRNLYINKKLTNSLGLSTVDWELVGSGSSTSNIVVQSTPPTNLPVGGVWLEV